MEYQNINNAELKENQYKKLFIDSIIVFLIIFSSFFVSQSWQGDNSFPSNNFYDFPLHAYRMWFVADHIQQGNFFFDFDFKSNTLFSRGLPTLPYLVGAPLVILSGLWNGISQFIVLTYLIIGLGMYFLGRTIGLNRGISLFMALTFQLSYALVLETQLAGALHRFFAIALLPWILICFLKKDQKKAQVSLAVLLGIAFLSHAGVTLHILVTLFTVTIIELITNLKRLQIESYLPLIGAVIAAGIIALPYFGPIIIEQQSEYINPVYLLENKGFFAQGIITYPEITDLFNRHFAFAEDKRVYGYVGISIIFLSLIGLYSINNLKFALAGITLIFSFILVGGNFVPAILQAGHYSRPIVFISFALSILSAFGLEAISEKLKVGNNLKIILASVIFLILFIDLSPGLTAFPSGSYKQPNIAQLYKSFDPNTKVFLTQPYIGYGWSSYSKASFVQAAPELINPEYAKFTQINFSSESAVIQNKFLLLGVTKVIALNSTSEKLQIKDYQVVSSTGFKPIAVILINETNTSKSSEIFEEIIKADYNPYLTGFLIRNENVREEDVDLILVKNKSKAKHITLEELQLLNDDAYLALKTIKTQTGIQISNPEPGWYFLPIMYYPHFRHNGKPVYEAGGGLTAIKVDSPTNIAEIYWERPWYDYLFWAMSFATLVLLGFLFLKNYSSSLK